MKQISKFGEIDEANKFEAARNNTQHVANQKTLFDVRNITEINYHPPVSIQKFLFSSQSFTNLKEVKWNQTRRAITIQEGVSTARSGQESNSA